MKIKLTFLGTGTSTGVPVIGCHCETCESKDPRDHRLRSSVLVSVEDGPNILIDAGPDFRYQMLKSRTEALDAVLLTHEHYDHVGGLDDVRGLNYTTRRSVDIYAQPNVAEAVRRNLHYVFTQKPYPGAPRIDLHEIVGSKFPVHGIEVQTLPVMHGGLPIIGFRIGPLAYITDASVVPDATIRQARGVKVAVINALGPLPHPSHMNLSQAIEVAKQIGAQRTYFTHISHKMPPMNKMTALPLYNMQLAYDGLSVSI